MKKNILLIALMLFAFLNVDAKTITVKTIAELQDAINKSVSDDVIILADGTYKDAEINIRVNGITVKAATAGGVIFNGSSSCKITGSKNTFSGFQFINGNIGTNKVVELGGNDNVLTHCNFYNYVSKNYIQVLGGSHHNEISYCNFEAKPATMNAGPGIQVTTSETIVSHTLIRFCTFMNFGGDGGDFGNEPIRIGLGIEQNNTSGTVVEFCYFENLGLGDSESISLKSTYNVVRNNTFNNNPLGQVVLRAGNKSVVYGNFFINSGGIRIKEGVDHSVFNNYFEGAGKVPSIQTMNFKLNQKTLVGEALNNIYIFHNTFYNAGEIDLGGQGDNPPKNEYFVNNIFYKESGEFLSNLNSNVTFTNNILYGGATMQYGYKDKEFKKVNPQLILNKNGFYSLAANSPAIDAAISNYPAIINNPEVNIDNKIMLDIDGQTRPQEATKKDIGCDEFTTGNMINKPLKRFDVGPIYIKRDITDNEKSETIVIKDTTKAVANTAAITDTSSFENEYFKVTKNFNSKSTKFDRVIVALTKIKVKSEGDAPKLERGDIKFIKQGTEYKVNKGEYFEISIKKDKLKPAKSKDKWIEPLKNDILFENETIKVFVEKLTAGDTRDLHNHLQRVVIRLNEVQLTDPRFTENKLPSAGMQIPNTAKFAEPVSHVVKNLSKIDLYNIVIEYKYLMKGKE